MAESKKKFVEVQDFNNWNPVKVGESIEGIYIEKVSGIGDLGSVKFIIETAPGVQVGVWGSAVLTPKMERVKVGTFVKIELVDFKKTKYKNDMKVFKLYQEQKEEGFTWPKVEL